MKLMVNLSAVICIPVDYYYAPAIRDWGGKLMRLAELRTI
jgi:hypothetical protein